MSLLADAAENKKYDCLVPIAVLEELERLVKDTSVYEFLRVPVDNGYNDCPRFIEDVKEYYRRLVEQEVFDSIGLVEEHEYERVFEEYFHHVKAFDLGEKLFIPARGEYVTPSEDLMRRIEGLLALREDVARFRSNLMTKIAAYSIDHPDEPINYRVLFPEIYSLLKQSFYRERDRALMIIEQNILRHFTDEKGFLDEKERGEVERALAKMSGKYGYCPNCARDVIAFVLRTR
jgi:predicted Ser/Thr protein kinase